MDKERNALKAGHRHAQSVTQLKLIVCLLGAGFALVKMALSPFLALPEWLLLGIATITQFWGGAEFYRSAWRGLKARSANMYTLIALGTSVAYGYSIAVFFFTSYFQALGLPSYLYFDASIFIVTFVLLGNYIEERSKQGASQAIKKLLSLQPRFALIRKKDGEDWKKVPIEDLSVGDVALVKAGERIPSDGVVIKGVSTIDESMITGESVPVSKKEGDAVIGASVNKTGTIEIKITQVGKHTTLSQIIQLVKQAQASRAPVQRLVDKVAAFFVPLVIILALIAFIIWYFLGPSPQLLHAIISVISVLIIACPCALGLATPLSIMISVGRAALHGVLIKDAEALEKVGKVGVVVFDKTGTLTTGKQAIHAMTFVSSLKKTVDTQGWQIPKEMDEKQFVLGLGFLLEEQSSHPLSIAYRLFVKDKLGTKLDEIKNITVERSSSLEGLGFEAIIQGRSLIIGSMDIMHQKKVALSKEVVDQADAWFNNGYSVSFFSIDRELVAYFAISDSIRPEAKEAVQWLKKHGLTTVMLTGDNERVATSVAKEIGIDKTVARVFPDQKVQHIQKLKKDGRLVAMVGDGINDAPALAEADVGIAIGSGTDIALETAQIILLSNDLLLVPFIIQLSRLTMRNIHQNLVWAFGYNLILIPVAMGALYPFFGITLHPVLAGGAMVLSSLSVVFNSLRLNYISLKGA